MFNFRFQKLSFYLSRRKSGILPASGRNFCKMVGHRHHKAQFKKSVIAHDNDQDPGGFRTNCKKFFKPTDIFLDCSQSPIFPWDRWVRRADILVSWCERNWGEYKMPVGRGDGVKRSCRALHHPYPRVFCTLPSFDRVKRPRRRPVGLNDRHLQSHGKIK